LIGVSNIALAEEAELKTGTFVRGKELLEQCSVPQLTEASIIPHKFCEAYIMGVLDLHLLSVIQTGKHVNICIKKDTTIDDISPSVTNWITAHPEQQNLPASLLIILALREKLPCSKP